MNIKFMEWNIHGMNGYKYNMPVNFINNEIIKVMPDVFVLIEYIDNEKFRELICKNYHIRYGGEYGNKVLIGVKKNICECDISNDSISKIGITADPGEGKGINGEKVKLNRPDMLQISFKINDKLIRIIGTRIHVSNYKQDNYKLLKEVQEINNKLSLQNMLEAKYRKFQFDCIVSEICKNNIYDATIVSGDFNCYAYDENHIDKLYTEQDLPRKDEKQELDGRINYYSYPIINKNIKEINYLLKTPNKMINLLGEKIVGFNDVYSSYWINYASTTLFKYDHLICSKNIRIIDEDFYYSWDFMKRIDYIKNNRNCPDHAKMIAEIEIVN